ncbi:uncharacterized protein LOC115220903 [Argonauta hians]
MPEQSCPGIEYWSKIWTEVVERKSVPIPESIKDSIKLNLLTPINTTTASTNTTATTAAITTSTDTTNTTTSSTATDSTVTATTTSTATDTTTATSTDTTTSSTATTTSTDTITATTNTTTATDTTSSTATTTSTATDTITATTNTTTATDTTSSTATAIVVCDADCPPCNGHKGQIFDRCVDCKLLQLTIIHILVVRAETEPETCRFVSQLINDYDLWSKLAVHLLAPSVYVSHVAGTTLVSLLTLNPAQVFTKDHFQNLVIDLLSHCRSEGNVVSTFSLLKKILKAKLTKELSEIYLNVIDEYWAKLFTKFNEYSHDDECCSQYLNLWKASLKRHGFISDAKLQTCYTAQILMEHSGSLITTLSTKSNYGKWIWKKTLQLLNGVLSYDEELAVQKHVPNFYWVICQNLLSADIFASCLRRITHCSSQSGFGGSEGLLNFQKFDSDSCRDSTTNSSIISSDINENYFDKCPKIFVTTKPYIISDKTNLCSSNETDVSCSQKIEVASDNNGTSEHNKSSISIEVPIVKAKTNEQCKSSQHFPTNENTDTNSEAADVMMHGTRNRNNTITGDTGDSIIPVKSTTTVEQQQALHGSQTMVTGQDPYMPCLGQELAPLVSTKVTTLPSLSLLRKLLLLQVNSYVVAVKHLDQSSSNQEERTDILNRITDEMGHMSSEMHRILNTGNLTESIHSPNPDTPVTPTGCHLDWLPEIFGEQDDAWIEIMLAVTDLYTITNTWTRLFQTNSSELSSILNPHKLFLQLLQSMAFDHCVLLDLLTSPETCFLLYFLKYLKLVSQEWNIFVTQHNTHYYTCVGKDEDENNEGGNNYSEPILSGDDDGHHTQLPTDILCQRAGQPFGHDRNLDPKSANSSNSSGEMKITSGGQQPWSLPFSDHPESIIDGKQNRNDNNNNNVGLLSIDDDDERHFKDENKKETMKEHKISVGLSYIQMYSDSEEEDDNDDDDGEDDDDDGKDESHDKFTYNSSSQISGHNSPRIADTSVTNIDHRTPMPHVSEEILNMNTEKTFCSSTNIKSFTDTRANIQKADNCPAEAKTLQEGKDLINSDTAAVVALVSSPPSQPLPVEDRSLSKSGQKRGLTFREPSSCVSSSLDQTLSCLIRLQLCVERLNESQVFPYNPEKLIQALQKCISQYES